MTRHDVVVSVGTDHHPFDRLVGWIDAFARARPDVAVFVQHGRSGAPQHADGSPLVPHEELRDRLAAARVAVTHGGPATIMDAREAGHRPLVVPRDPRLGEHVDDHQQRFARRLAEVGDIQVAQEADELTRLLDELLRAPSPSARTSAPATDRRDTVAHIGAMIEAVERHGGRRLPGRPRRSVPEDVPAPTGAR